MSWFTWFWYWLVCVKETVIVIETKNRMHSYTFDHTLVRRYGDPHSVWYVRGNRGKFNNEELTIYSYELRMF